jgi:hypothetical protein
MRTSPFPPTLDRREFFSFARNGIGSVALTSLLLRDCLVEAGKPADGIPRGLHHPPKARRVIHITACGGVSQIDTFDHKPALERFHGKSLLAGEKPDVFFGQVGLLRKSDWRFRRHGESARWVSELLPHMAGVVDELTLIHSMFAETSNHTPATFQQSTGFRLNGFPVLGSWLSYGLGSETDELPAYVVIPDTRGVPAGGSINWSNGFLPARHQGVVIRSQGTPIDDLHAARPLSPATEVESRELLESFNHRHAEQHGDEDVLLARMRSYELAAKMQLAVPDVAHLDQETAATQSQYGLDNPQTVEFGRGCLLARRLIERGVRFVQLFAGGAFGSPRINWDGHEDMRLNHSREALRIDKPIAGLLRDLRQRGLLDDTLVLFTSEFGRTPFSQSAADQVGPGRDHNQNGFTVWMAGAGLKPGTSYGATDEVGYRAVENPVHWNDFHATILHLLGIDHERLTFYHNGIQRRLTNVAGHVVRDVLS